MLPFHRFNNEADFREKFVKPLLNRLGFYGVSEQHGTQEFGKDFVFSELHRLGGMRHFAAQVKHEEQIKQGPSVDGLLSQVRQAFSTPFTRADSIRKCQVCAVYIFNSGKITTNAKDQLLNSLEREHYGDNVHFLDGERLEALDERGTLQSDANDRARLLGLRAALRAIRWDLEENRIQGKETLTPVFVRGIELYLSEPVNDEFIGSLFKLWNRLQGIEGLRAVAPLTSERARAQLSNIADIARGALPLVDELSQKVDAVIEKMKPLV